MSGRRNVPLSKMRRPGGPAQDEQPYPAGHRMEMHDVRRALRNGRPKESDLDGIVSRRIYRGMIPDYLYVVMWVARHGRGPNARGIA